VPSQRPRLDVPGAVTVPGGLEGIRFALGVAIRRPLGAATLLGFGLRRTAPTQA
jgi:hypothetical protein